MLAHHLVDRQVPYLEVAVDLDLINDVPLLAPRRGSNVLPHIEPLVSVFEWVEFDVVLLPLVDLAQSSRDFISLCCCVPLILLILAFLGESLQILPVLVAQLHHCLVCGDVLQYSLLINGLAHLPVGLVKETLLYHKRPGLDSRHVVLDILGSARKVLIYQLVWLVAGRLWLVTPQLVAHEHVLAA